MKLFVFTNVALSNESSDGRTLLNLINDKYPSSEVFNFYMNSSFSSNLIKDFQYYKITNSDVLYSFKHFGKKKPSVCECKCESQNHSSIQKNAKNMILRNLIWKSQKWVYKELHQKIVEFKPDCLVIQMGDFAYLFDVVRTLSNKTNIPIITFNSETYALKEHDYMIKTLKPGFAYRCFKNKLFKAEDKLYKVSEYNYCLTDDIKELLTKHFCLRHVESYIPQSTIKKIDKVEHKEFNIVYAGNLGVGRFESLLLVAYTLEKIDPSLVINVYSDIDDYQKEKLLKTPNIKFNGLVSYDYLIKKVYPTTDLLLFVESFDEYYLTDSKYAFSTKIMDYLASGIPTFVFAPKEFSGTNYLSKHLNDDCISTSENNLYDKLESTINNIKENKKTL